MTPKEKAKELIYKYWSCEYQDIAIPITAVVAKQYALIAVDEIIKSLVSYGDESNELQNMDRELNYWDEVKNEILKM